MGKPQLREVNKTSPRKSIAKIGIELKYHISPLSENYIKMSSPPSEQKQTDKLQIDSNISNHY